MANAATLLQHQAVRALIVGYPGAGKTGALASLLNAGFKMRYLDFDGNIEPLMLYADREKLANLDIMYFEDKMRVGAQFMEPVGIPTAFKEALDAMDHWKYTEQDGTVVDLGASKDWGPETIVVLDSLTAMGEAAFRRAMKLSNKTPMNTTDRVWGLAMAEQLAFIQKLTSFNNKFHVIVLAHLKMISPKSERSGDSDLTKELKEQVANLLPTRLYPSALGWQLPQVIGGEFPTLLEIVATVKAGQVKRVIKTVPRVDLDVKVPAPNLPKELDITDGMLTIFKALSPQSVALVSGNGAAV